MNTNKFQITGRIAQDVKVNQLTNSSVARFGIGINQKDKNDNWHSAFLNFEAWRKNDNTADFDLLKKGQRITVEGFFKADEYEKDGEKFQKVTLIATKWEAVENEEKEPKEEPKEEPKKKNNKKKEKEK